jgi:putative FmdB family regulatory protein
MPVYTYKCQSCSVKFERTQMFSDQSLTRCPECHTNTVRRIPQLPAIIFKGPGWYSIDHRSPSGQKIGALSKMNDKPGNKTGNKSES